MVSRAKVFICSEGADGLQAGEPAIFDAETLALIEEPTAFLRAWYTDSGRRASKGTWANAAYAIGGWLEFMAVAGIPDWRHASQDDLLSYKRMYSVAYSPKTGRPYASGTIANRMSTICKLYAYGRRKGWYFGDITDEVPETSSIRSVVFSQDLLAHTRRGVGVVRKATDLIPRRRAAKTAIKPLTTIELQALIGALGPRASETDTITINCRDRLIIDLAWSTGLRLQEIANLTAQQFLRLTPATAISGIEHPISTIGKGNKRRTIALPNWVLLDALAFIRSHNGFDNNRLNRPLLVSTSYVGGETKRGISPRRIQQVFADACLDAGLTSVTECTPIAASNAFGAVKPSHSFHDLRHTYAVLTYWAEREFGNPEPWKKIQAQLGHTHLKTTIDTYLHWVEIFGRSQGIDLRTMLSLK